VAGRSAFWHNRYNPQSPAAIHLTNECVRATIIADRANRYQQAEVERQCENTRKNWRRRRLRQVAATIDRIPEVRLDALSDLGKFSHGCRAVADNLADWIKTIRSQGYLQPAELGEVIFNHGHWPIAPAIASDPTAYKLHVLNLACTPGVTPEALDTALEPASRPEALRGLAREQILPADPRRCARRLVALLKVRRAAYIKRARKLERKVDVPELVKELDRASILKDAALRRYNRCHAESRISFDRSYKALCEALERDAEEAEDEDPSGRSGSEGSVESAGGAPSAPEPGERDGSGLPNEHGDAPGGSSQVADAVVSSAEQPSAHQSAPNPNSGGSGRAPGPRARPGSSPGAVWRKGGIEPGPKPRAPDPHGR
jgi:hypothetical protein